MTGHEDIWHLAETDIVRLLSTHYHLQAGALITQTAQSNSWIESFSSLTSAPMWNHIAWLGTVPPSDVLAQAEARWSKPTRRPTVYLAERVDALSGLKKDGESGFERCDQESWMVYPPEQRVTMNPRNALTIRLGETGPQMLDFLEVFCAAYQTQPQVYASVFACPPGPPGPSPRQTEHFIAYAGAEAVCVASLIRTGNAAGIYNVGTTPRARKKGFAAHLTAHLIEHARHTGIRWLFLQAERGSNAERIYRQLGFKTVFLRTGYRLARWHPAAHAESQAAPEHCGAFTASLLMALSRAGVSAAPSLSVVRESWFRIPETLRNQIGRYSKEHSVRPEVLWIGAWAVLLNRYTHRSEVQFELSAPPAPNGSSAASGRRVLTVTVPERSAAVPWLREVQSALDGPVRRGEDIGSFSGPVVAWSVGEKSLESGLHFTTEDQAGIEAQFIAAPVQCAIRWSPSPELTVKLKADNVDPTAQVRILRHWCTLVENITQAGDTAVSRLELLSAAERADLSQPVRAGESIPSQQFTVVECFEEAAARFDLKPAVILASPPQADGAPLSYRELNRRVRRLARQLRHLGVGNERVVGIYMERSVDVIIALLAVLKSGSAALPLDPTSPTERLQFMVDDAQATVVLVQSALDCPIQTARVFVVDDKAAEISPAEEAAPPIAAEHAAYIIYTSGSTGKPKGVVVSHGALARHCLEASAEYQLRSEDRVLQFNSITFDAAFEQIFTTLICGATLILRGSEIWTSEEFTRCIDRHALSVLDLPTIYWHQVLQDWHSRRCSLPRHLPRLMVVGGEAMLPHSLRLWKALPFRQVRLLNAYGPTETVITASTYEVSRELLECDDCTRVPIGRPRGERHFLVLDALGRLVPTGVPGELYIGGPLLARGYLNRPELTAQRFLPNPFGQTIGQRLYRTGDLVRRLPDGQFEFLGRADHQVKIRGFRVELGEIEMALQEHPALRESVVILHEHEGRPMLAGYIVPRNGACPSPRELRTYLKKRLPQYMVPGTFAALTALPLLPSGKIDRRALAQTPAQPLAGSITSPRDPLELRLQLLFERILNRSDIGVEVTFFELGGDSLQALELIVGIERLSGKSLPFETLYQSSSVESLARLLQESTRSTRDSSLVLLQSGRGRPPVFFIHTTPGDILGYGNLIYHLDAEQACYGFQSLGLINSELSHKRVEEMAAHYVGLLRQCQGHGPYFLAGWCYGGLLAVEMARQLELQGERVAFLGLLETVAAAPSLLNYRYYAHRMQCFLRMSPAQWWRYFKAKARYRREVKLANRMRFQRLEKSSDGDIAALEERNRRLSKLEHVYNINLEALRFYRPKPFMGKIILFNAEQVDAGVIADPLYAWPGLVTDIEVHTVPGDHDSMLTEPNVAVLARKFQEALHRAQAHWASPGTKVNATVDDYLAPTPV